MLEITRFTCENLSEGCVTDEKNPRFSYTLSTDQTDTVIKDACLSINNWEQHVNTQIAIPYEGEELKPFTKYTANLTVTMENGEQTKKQVEFETGRLDTPWEADWISNKNYTFKEKKISPIPMTFRKKLTLEKKVVSAKIYATALGIYELSLNGAKVGNEYFAPGFTSYKSHLQYQTYDVTNMLSEKNELIAVVAGGWAVGSFIFTRKNRITADRQALLLELHVSYEDGTREVIGTDESWQVTDTGNYLMADFYDGETYSAEVDLDQVDWCQAGKERIKIHPELLATYGAPVHAHEEMKPISCTETPEGLVYDFGQNFAGVVKLNIKGKKGQKIEVRHAEILKQDGTLNTDFLRTAKACATYICREGEQEYSPRLTYMGFRYICIDGVREADIEVSALVLYSDIKENGSFSCSNAMLNRLQENIIWSSKSNFVDIPTDCPQRDERMGWTGDIAVFAPTACYNYDMSRFLPKWLKDVKAEQLPTGGIPNTVPAQGFGFPATMPVMAVDFWGDACVMVPWAEYQARGDIKVLEECYSTMTKYVDACKFWAGLFSVGQKRYIWSTPSVFHFGDWVAPDVPKMSQWQGRSKWTATASLCNTSKMVAKVAELLGKTEDAKKYQKISEKTAAAYVNVFTDGNGKLNNEFQTGYVLPIHFNMFSEAAKKQAVKNLAALVEKSDYCIGTGFPGTPYILFALADNGYADVAYQMLLNTKCPSWLYEVKMGATTIWERWDGLDENGVCPIGDDGTDMMISYNHYASGAVGDFMYRRIAGIEPVEAGYKKFKVEPLVGGDLTWAKGSVDTPYGEIKSDWKIENGRFMISVKVPFGTNAELIMPDHSVHSLSHGEYRFAIDWTM